MCDQCVVDCPQRITGCSEIVLGLDDAFFMTAGDEHQGTIEGVHIIQENRNIHGTLGWHHVVVQPGAVILMPLPDVAFKRHLAVDLELMHVKLFTE